MSGLTHFEAFAQRLLIGEVSARESLIDNDRRYVFPRVLLREESTLQQGKPQRLKIARAYQPVTGNRVVSRIVSHPAFHGKIARIVLFAQWQRSRRPNGFHAGKGRDPV